MKRKQAINKQHQQDGDDSSDCTYDAEEETTQQQQRHHKKMRAVKREHSSSDSDDSDAATSWSSPNLLTAKDLPLRAMKQSVVQWIRQTYSVAAHGWTAKADIFEDYLSEWARMGKEPQLTAPAFGRLVHKAFPGIKSCRMGPRIRARHCYKGLVRREGLDSSASSPAHSPISSSVVSSPSVESSTTTTTTATSSPYSTSAASSPQQQPHDYNHHHHDGHQKWAQHNMEQVLIDLESELETEMLSMGNVKQEPLTDDTEEVTEAYGVPQYYPPQPQPQHYYPAEQNQGTTYYSAPDADTGCTSSSSPSPTVASPYEWSTFPPTATTPAGMPFFTSLPAYTSSVSVPLPPNYYYPAATTSLPYHYPYPAWPSYPAASTAVAGGFGVVDNCAAAPFAYTSMPPATSMLYSSSEAVPAPQPSSLSLSSSGRSDVLLSSFLSFDL